MKNPYENRNSLSYKFRARRFSHVKKLVHSILEKKGKCRVLDVGGTEIYWDIADSFVDNKDIQIDLLNLEESQTSRSNFQPIVGDACDLSDIDDNAYDLCHSNSVIEHVGSWQKMINASREIARVAPSYFVQTPYFWFPIEPHYRRPCIHWLPEQIRARMLMKKDLGFYEREQTISDAMTTVQHVYLLDKSQFSDLFPDGRVVHEKFGVLTKSLMAIRE